MDPNRRAERNGTRMTTQTTFEGVTIKLTSDRNSFCDWAVGEDGTVDIDATMARYEDAICTAVEQAYPGATVEHHWDDDDRVAIHGTVEAVYEVEHAEVKGVIANCYPDGDPEPFIVWANA